MDRNQASRICRQSLDEHGLTSWGVRLTTDINAPFLGLCMHRDKCIILNAHHIDIHPDLEIIDTIRHEVAHAIVGPFNGHNEIWSNKAREIGCSNTLPCSHLNLPPHIIDAIRSGNTIEVTTEEETHVIRRPKYEVTRLQDFCPDCLANGKKTVAKERFSFESIDQSTGDTIKLITLECFHILKKVIPKGTPFESMVSNYWKPEIKDCKHEWNKNQCKKCNEFRLFNFQVIGARFAESALASQKGVGIFDDMGLGKTMQALAILRFHSDKYTPTIIVSKSALKFQWFKAAVIWLGPEFIGQIISTSKDSVLPGLKIYIIPYDLLRRFPREKLYKLGIKLVILDEVQQIKNPDSSRTQEVRKLISSNSDCKVIELSGTPWKNRGSEYFPALNLIDPIKFYSYQHYLDTWVDYFYHGSTRKMGGIRNIAKFKEYTSGLVIRREYNDVMDEFPDINRMKLPVQIDELMQTQYDESVSEFVEWYNNHVLGGEEDKISGIEMLAKMARMRHVTGLAKIPATLEFLNTFVEDTDRKIVVFVHHKDVGHFLFNSLTNTNKESNGDWYHLAELLKSEGISVLAYTSQHTGQPEGYAIQDRFNNEKKVIMIASTLACGEGLNLQSCSDAIMHERQWNPQNEDQAAPGRFRRIGQTSKVINITFPEAEGTIDEHLDGLVEGKRRQFHDAMNSGELNTWSQESLGKELAEIIVKKHREKMSKSGRTKSNIASKAAFTRNKPIFAGL